MATHKSVAWPPIVATSGASTLTIRQATQQDVPILERWDRDPEVIACVTDDPSSSQAFVDAVWSEEIAGNGDTSCYYIAELDGRPIGAMQVIDPHLEPTHYWEEIEPNLRAIDIWIGDDRDRNAGHGRVMMETVIDRCFADADITAIVIDPLNSNTEAHRFYRRLGFKVVGRRMFGDDDCLVHRLDRAAWRQGS